MTTEDSGLAKEVFSLGFVLLLISLFALLLVSSQYWEVWALSVLGVLVMIEGVKLHVEERRLMK